MNHLQNKRGWRAGHRKTWTLEKNQGGNRKKNHAMKGKRGEGSSGVRRDFRRKRR